MPEELYIEFLGLHVRINSGINIAMENPPFWLGCASWWANEQWMTIFPPKWRANGRNKVGIEHQPVDGIYREKCGYSSAMLVFTGG